MALGGLCTNMICIRNTLFNIMKYKTNTHNWSTCLCSHLYIITHYEGQSSYPPQRAQCEFESPITIRLPLFHWLQLTCKNHGRRKKKEKSSTVHKFQQKVWQSNLDMPKYFFFFWGGGARDQPSKVHKFQQVVRQSNQDASSITWWYCWGSVYLNIVWI